MFKQKLNLAIVAVALVSASAENAYAMETGGNIYTFQDIDNQNNVRPRSPRQLREKIIRREESETKVDVGSFFSPLTLVSGKFSFKRRTETIEQRGYGNTHPSQTHNGSRPSHPPSGPSHQNRPSSDDKPGGSRQMLGGNSPSPGSSKQSHMRLMREKNITCRTPQKKIHSLTGNEKMDKQLAILNSFKK